MKAEASLGGRTPIVVHSLLMTVFIIREAEALVGRRTRPSREIRNMKARRMLKGKSFLRENGRGKIDVVSLIYNSRRWEPEVGEY